MKAEVVLRPVDSWADTEEAGRGQVFQDGDQHLELVPQASAARWVGQSYCEGFIAFRLGIEDGSDLQHLKQLNGVVGLLLCTAISR